MVSGPSVRDAVRRCCIQKNRTVLNVPIIFAVTSLLLFILANVFPFMRFELHGPCFKPVHLSTGVWEFFERGMWELGLLVLAASILFPGLKIHRDVVCPLYH